METKYNFDSKSGKIRRCAKRMSLWMKDGGEWKMRYHQATAIKALTV